MPLNHFHVIRARPSEDDPIIACYDGRQRVVATVELTAWDDYFGFTDDGPSKEEANLLANANLDTLTRIIKRKYAAGQFESLRRAGSTLPHITLKLQDISPARLKRDALDLCREAGVIAEERMSRTWRGESHPNGEVEFFTTDPGVARRAATARHNQSELFSFLYSDEQHDVLIFGVVTSYRAEVPFRFSLEPKDD